jgi:hypothetical protein
MRDMYSFTDSEDKADFGPLLNFWYRANSNAISAALAAHPGIKIIIDQSPSANLDLLTKKLFLLAYTIVVRNCETNSDTEVENSLLMPKDGNYEPAFLKEVIDDLNKLNPPLLTVRGPDPYWSSSDKMLNSGIDCAYAIQMGGGTPKNIIEFLANQARSAVEKGQIIYAPFIPPAELELEFVRNGTDFNGYFDTQPLYTDQPWLGSNHLITLFRIKFPCLDGLDIETMTKVKQDYREEFETFSRAILKAIQEAKSSIGSGNFSTEIRRIQRDIVDAGLSDVQKASNKIKRSPALQKQGLVIGLLFLAGAAYLGAPPWLWATGLGASAVKLVTDKVTELVDCTRQIVPECASLRHANKPFNFARPAHAA